MAGRWVRAAAVGGAALVGFLGGAVRAQEERAIVTWETGDGAGSFRAFLVGADQVAAVEAELAGGPPAGIPNGAILPGDGGVNVGHDWHLEEIELADVTTEVCDATVEYVDAHLDDFLALGRYCPWSAVVIAVEPVDDGGDDDADNDAGDDDDVVDLPETGVGETRSWSPRDGAAMTKFGLLAGSAALLLGLGAGRCRARG